MSSDITPPPTPEGDLISRAAALSFPDRWLAAFGSVEIKHTSAREYAVAAVTDLRDCLASLPASQAQGEEGTPDPSEDVAHPDDYAVARFAAFMKAKLAAKRAEGRSGWDGPDCNADILSAMLRAHVEKGDPLDVGNFAMMLHQRGERISATPAPVNAGVDQRETLQSIWNEAENTGDLDAIKDMVRAALRTPPPSSADGEGGEG